MTEVVGYLLGGAVAAVIAIMAALIIWRNLRWARVHGSQPDPMLPAVALLFAMALAGWILAWVLAGDVLL